MNQPHACTRLVNLPLGGLKGACVSLESTFTQQKRGAYLGALFVQIGSWVVLSCGEKRGAEPCCWDRSGHFQGRYGRTRVTGTYAVAVHHIRRETWNACAYKRIFEAHHSLKVSWCGNDAVVAQRRWRLGTSGGKSPNLHARSTCRSLDCMGFQFSGVSK